jgi:UrcA family protein
MNTLRNALAIAVLGVVGTCASAAASDAPPTKTVHFAELDLSTNEGATQLFRRLRAAAKEVCAPMNGNAVMQRSRYRTCVQTSLANAVNSVDQPLVFMAAEAAGVKPLRLAAR